jgi:ribonuclease BN (tRNA processing enzyme)
MMEKANGHPLCADIFVTHTHWDHIQGIPFFQPIFADGTCLRLWAGGTERNQQTLERVIREQMSPDVFPVPFADLPSSVEFGEVEPGKQYGRDCVLTAMPVQHPGSALGFRVTDGTGGGAMVYISDNELERVGQHALDATWRKQLVRWAHGAKVLVHDAMYMESEYDMHRGWGHSTCDQAVELALEAEVGELLLYHHKPDREDGEVDAMVGHCEQLVSRRGGTLKVRAAAEGMELVV